MALEFADVVVKMVKAKQRLEAYENEVKQRNETVKKALETLLKRTKNILDNPLENGDFEIVFLDEALDAVNKAEHEYEISFTLMIASRDKVRTLEEFVEAMREEKE